MAITPNDLPNVTLVDPNIRRPSQCGEQANLDWCNRVPFSNQREGEWVERALSEFDHRGLTSM